MCSWSYSKNYKTSSLVTFPSKFYSSYPLGKYRPNSVEFLGKYILYLSFLGAYTLQQYAIVINFY